LLVGQAEARAAGEQAVLGVARHQLRCDFRRLPIRRRHHDGFLQRLHVPAEADELRRQPVEQLGVTRRLGLRTEVLRRLHEAVAEELFPSAVHPHTRGQWIFRRHQPLREAEAIRRRASGERRQHSRHARADLVAFLVVFTTHEDESVAGLRDFLHHHRGRELRFVVVHGFLRSGDGGIGGLHGAFSVGAEKLR